jgi:hypothetical protein
MFGMKDKAAAPTQRPYDYAAEYAEHKAAVAEAEAKHYPPEKQAEMLQGFVDSLSKDVAEYVFECERHGDFLAIKATRLGQKFATAINLTASTDIRPTEGSPPAMDGIIRYYIQHTKTDGSDDSFSRTPIGRAGAGYKLEAFPSTDEWNGHHPIFEIDREADRHGGMMYGSSNQCQEVSRNMPRRARDDTIRFNGARATLYMPHGKGNETFAAILAALS